jgi:DNA relaxase NicK
MTVETSLDYIQANAFISESEMRSKSIEKIAPARFYKRGYKDTNGTRYFFGNPNSKKTSIVMAGKALVSVRNEGFSDQDICKSLLEREGTFSRLDLAVTQWDEPDMVTLADMQRYFKEGKIKSPLVQRGGKLVSSMDLDGELYPETFYVGDLKKRGDKGLFRAYDKGHELDISRFLMIRLELEERKGNANADAKRIAEGNSVGSVFRSRFDIEDEKFQKIINAPSAKIQRGTAKEREDEMSEDEKRWKWLIEQVAPTLRKAIEKEGEQAGMSENVSSFILAAGLRAELLNAANIVAKRNIFK